MVSIISWSVYLAAIWTLQCNAKMKYGLLTSLSEIVLTYFFLLLCTQYTIVLLPIILSSCIDNLYNIYIYIFNFRLACKLFLLKGT